MFDVVVIGRTVWDHWLIDASDLRPGNLDAYGGPGANVAVHLAGLGLRVALVSVLGTDARSDEYRRHLSSVGVDCRYVASSNGRIATCEISPGKHYGWVGDNIGLPSDVVPWADILPWTRAVFCAEVTRGLEPGVFAGHSYWSPQLALRRPAEFEFAEVQSGWRAAFFNKGEAELLSLHFGAPFDVLSRESPETTWLVTNESSPTTTSVGEIRRNYAVPKTKVRVSIGGGDAFAAAYCAADLKGYGQEEAVRLGHALAREVVAQVGCQLEPRVVRSVATRLRYGV